MLYTVLKILVAVIHHKKDHNIWGDLSVRDWVISVIHHCSCILELPRDILPHSSTLAWKIPWMEEPGRLRSMGSLRV